MFSDVFERPVPSLLRGYSAPVRLESDLTDSDLSFLLAYDSDEFNRYVFFTAVLSFWPEPYGKVMLIFYLLSWEAGQTLARKLMLHLVDDFQNDKPLFLDTKFVEGFKRILSDSSLDKVCSKQDYLETVHFR